jgi:hypothetical protein
MYVVVGLKRLTVVGLISLGPSLRPFGRKFLKKKEGRGKGG